MKDTLDAEGKPEASSVGASSGIFYSAKSFSQWYRDVPGVNYRFEKYIDLEVIDEEKEIYHFKSSEFFPVGNNEGFGAEVLNDKQLDKNFWFTTELHLEFVYQRDQSFDFSGDDDLWIFVDGHLALDLGGVHSAMDGSIDLNALGDRLGLVAGKQYAMDIFHAERHTSRSNFEITASIGCIFVPG